MDKLFSDSMPTIEEVKLLTEQRAGFNLAKLVGNSGHVTTANQMMAVLILNERVRNQVQLFFKDRTELAQYRDGIMQFLDDYSVPYKVSESKCEITLPGDTYISFGFLVR